MTTRRIGRLVLLRHGESMWNVTDRAKKRETRFTGWADVPISQLGREQARASGRCMESLKLSFDSVFTSLLHRSRVTYELILQEMPSQIRKAVPVVHSWRLNERHYGALVGLSKTEAEEKMGREKVLGWRRSWNLRPPPMTMHPFYHSISSDPTDKAPLFDWQSEIWTKALTIRSIQLRSGKLVEEEKKHDHNAVIPKTESLEDTSHRVYTLWVEDILPRLVKGSTVLVVGHSNTIRSMVKQLDNLDEHHIMDVVIPSAIPLVYNFGQEPGGVVRPLGKPGTSGMRGRFVVTKELLELNLAASQHLEMSEFLDEGTDFKDMISDTLERVRGSGAGGVRSSFMDAEINAAVGKHSSVMEAGWMTFDNSQENLKKLQRIEKEDDLGVR